MPTKTTITWEQFLAAGVEGRKCEIEVHSPSDKPSEIQSKRKDYQKSGVIQVWIDPEKHLVELVYPNRPLEYFQEGQPLVIAGLADFALDLKDLFAIRPFKTG